MAEHKLNPREGETWFHPNTFNAYRIHSFSPDGWVRYQALTPTGTTLPMITTMPTLDFVRIYRLQVSSRKEASHE